MLIAAIDAGGMGLSLLAMALAALAVVWQTRGREIARRQWDRRRHPARAARIVATAAAVVGGGAATAVVAAESAARPALPQGSAVVVGPESDGPRPATFVLVNAVPGDGADPEPITSSGGSF